MDQKCLRKMPKAINIRITGRVQGVGFRPFIFSLARKWNVKGTVQNNLDGVRIVAEGREEDLSSLLQDIRLNPPRLSRLDEVMVEDIPVQGFKEFGIIPSERSGASALVIPVDSSVCSQCLEEMMDPGDLRYRYPFINCTQCGPRYTIIEQLPYDRIHTSMASFPMCEACRRDYEDPLNRRHHAQPIACPDCGPRLSLLTMNGETLDGDPLRQTQRLLKQGAIVAIKGLGGYHLACLATDEHAVRRLRARKNRPSQPFALMAANLREAGRYCWIDREQAYHLESPERPIVILPKKPGVDLPECIAPGMNTLGIMLPYTPLHVLLFDGELSLLVMTSANPSGLPILSDDELVFPYLQGMADYVLTHNRKILHPLDDSVVRVQPDVPYFLRRSRGFVPDPIAAGRNVHEVIALGPQQKNTFALGRHQQIFLGPHIGDMEHWEVTSFYQKALDHLSTWMGIDPKVIAVDLHPDYTTTRLGREMKGIIVPVQHHHAHMVSCMVDNGLAEPCFGIILDGTGYGEDGHMWGFEVLYGDASSCRRIAHLMYTPLPGGEKAIREPWRNAVGMLYGLFAETGRDWARTLFPERERDIAVLVQMIKKGIHSPLAGTCGRLFDAVSAILGVCPISTYDGEAAIRMSEWVEDGEWGPDGYPFAWKKGDSGQAMIVDPRPGLEKLVQDRLGGVSQRTIIRRFHQMVVSACVQAVVMAGKQDPRLNRKVVLSGGSFHNPYLSSQVARHLRNAGFEVFTHKRVPSNDGGLSLGQLMIAAAAQSAGKGRDVNHVYWRAGENYRTR